MKRIYLMSLGLAATLVAGSAQGADKGRFGHFRVSYSLNFNVSADFSSVGGAVPGPSPTAPLVAPGDVQLFDDGFIGMDISGNAGGLTTFWGYNNASQVVGGALQLSSTAGATGLSSSNIDAGLTHGVDLTYCFQLKGWDSGGWGFEAGFGWMPVGITDGQTVSGPLTVAIIPLGGMVPPVPPYTGTVAGPGPLLDTTTGTVTIPNGTLISGNRDIDATVWAFHFGPYLDYNLSEHVSLTLAGGLSLALVDSEFTFNEIKTPVIGTPATTSGQNRSSDLLVGGYLSARVAWWLTDNVNLFTGVTYQNVGSFDQQANGRNARLNLGGTVALNVGLGFSF